MTSDEDSSMLGVRSPDGTEIASWQTGSGPPLVLVHGTPAQAVPISRSVALARRGAEWSGAERVASQECGDSSGNGFARSMCRRCPTPSIPQSSTWGRCDRTNAATSTHSGWVAVPARVGGSVPPPARRDRR